MLFGAAYAAPALVLALLALGHYFHAALGFNSATLGVYGRVRDIIRINLVSAVVAVGLALLLIPRYGAVGAALGTAPSLIVYNLLNQFGICMEGTGIRLVDARFVQVDSVTAALLIGLMLLQWMISPPVYVSVALAAIVPVLDFRLTRRVLKPDATFPELLRIPLLRWLLT